MRVPTSCAIALIPLLLLNLSAAGAQRSMRSFSDQPESNPPAFTTCTTSRWRTSDAGVSVGAIRWDAWFAGSSYERFLDPEQWHSRVPFYGTILSPTLVQVRADSGVVMDQEIGFAAAAGLTYWAFNYYHPKSFAEAELFNTGLQLYLSSPCRDQINFALLLQGIWLGPVEEWPETVSTFVTLLQTPGYQTVAGGRPLVYLYEVDSLFDRFGSWPQARTALDAFRSAALQTGMQNPYIVALMNPPGRAAAFAEVLGLDAIGAYSATGAPAPGDRPFGELRQANESFWSHAAATGKAVVPPLNLGWDPRPRAALSHGHAHGPAGEVLRYQTPAPDELRDHVKSAMNWTTQRAGLDPGTILVYAWNEFDEGGWLAPTLSEGTARIDAFAQALREVDAGAPTELPAHSGIGWRPIRSSH